MASSSAMQEASTAGEGRLHDGLMLLQQGLAFDWLAEELDFAVDDTTTPPLVKVEDGVKALAADSQLVREKLSTLIRLQVERKLSDQEYYFNLARLAAVHQLTGVENREDLPSDLKAAVTAYLAAGRLGTSAVDILASAILLPEETFLNPCIAANHNIRVLAGEFNLPKGAIALRQEVYHSTSSGGENVDGGTDVG